MPNTQNKPKIISVFNNKGGVGKTTYLYHLAHLLAESGKKVLCVDCDGQCNLTAYFLENNIIKKIEDILSKNPNQVLNSIFNKNLFNSNYEGLEEVLSPVIGLNGDYKYKDPISIPLEHQQNTNSKNIKLIAGSQNITRYEELLSNNTNTLEKTQVRTQTALYRYILEVASQNDIDIVLCDLSPNLGALNKNIIGFSDRFIIPLNTDLFSIQGLANLGSKIAEWKDYWKMYNSNYINHKKSEEKYKVPQGNVLLTGYVVQRFGISNGRMATAFEAFAQLFTGCINEYVARPLGQTFGTGQFFNIGEIPNYNSLIPIAMNAGKPIFDLVSKDFHAIDGSSITYTNSKIKMSECKAAYTKSCKVILELLQPII